MAVAPDGDVSRHHADECRATARDPLRRRQAIPIGLHEIVGTQRNVRSAFGVHGTSDDVEDD
jgi:hypothetical protein